MAKEILQADNFHANNLLERSLLTADAAASQAVITVENPQGYSTSDYLLVGNIGSDRAEIRKISSITGNSITFTSNLSIAHTKQGAVIKLRGNQIKFYRATNVDGSVPDDDSFSLIATVSIEADQLETEYVDSVGGSGYWYKYTYYNEHSEVETSLSDAYAARGGGYNRFATVDQVKITAGLKNNKYITDAEVSEAIEEAESQVKASLTVAGYILPFDEIPFMVRHITRLLAAGSLLSNGYGSQRTGTEKEGSDKIKQALAILKQIESKSISLVENIDDSDIDRGDSVSGYPDASAVSNTPSEDRMFSVTDVF